MNPPRMAPATRREMGSVNSAITAVLGVAAGTQPPNLFTTLAKHRRLFRPWLRFAAALMPGGVLPRADSELVILRVAHLCGCEYEWRHHVRLAREQGLTGSQIDDVRTGPDAPGWSPRQALLLRATDELHQGTEWSMETWRELQLELAERELIELPMLVGHYTMLAMTINGLQIQPDEPRQPTSAAGRATRALTSRISRRGA